MLHSFGVPITPKQIDEVALLLWRPVNTARQSNYTAARRYIADLHEPISVPPIHAFPMAAVVASIEPVVTAIRINGEEVTEANRTDTRVIEEVRKAIEGPIERQALAPARETVEAIGEDEGQPRIGWARELRGAYSCSFCAMLASMGPRYSSKEAAEVPGGSGLSSYHTSYINKQGVRVGGVCDCVAVPVIMGKPWEGQAAYRQLKALWKEQTQGYSGRDARLAFRREWDKQVRAKETQRYLPTSLQKKAA